MLSVMYLIIQAEFRLCRRYLMGAYLMSVSTVIRGLSASALSTSSTPGEDGTHRVAKSNPWHVEADRDPHPAHIESIERLREAYTAVVRKRYLKAALFECGHRVAVEGVSRSVWVRKCFHVGTEIPPRYFVRPCQLGNLCLEGHFGHREVVVRVGPIAMLP